MVSEPESGVPSAVVLGVVEVDDTGEGVGAGLEGTMSLFTLSSKDLSLSSNSLMPL